MVDHENCGGRISAQEDNERNTQTSLQIEQGGVELRP